MGPLSCLAAALPSLQLCSAPPSPGRRPRGRRVVRGSPRRLADLEVVRALAPALFGDVLLCRDRADGGRLLAVKRVDAAAARARRTVSRSPDGPAPGAGRPGVPVLEDVAGERRAHRALAARGPQPHVALLREEIACGGQLLLLFDYCAGGDLFDHVRAAERLPERRARRCLREVVAALRELRAVGLAHRDISLENVLLDADGTCRLADLGLAIGPPVKSALAIGPPFKSGPAVGPPADSGGPIEPPKTGLVPAGRVGKSWYMAPEVYAGDAPYCPFRADMWSLGVMLSIMVTGAPLVLAPHAEDAHFRSMQARGGSVAALFRFFPPELSPEAFDLLSQLVVVDPARRLSLEQVARHPFLLDGPPTVEPHSMEEHMASTPRASSGLESRGSWASSGGSTASSDDLDGVFSP